MGEMKKKNAREGDTRFFFISPIYFLAPATQAITYKGLFSKVWVLIIAVFFGTSSWENSLQTYQIVKKSTPHLKILALSIFLSFIPPLP